MVHPQRFAMKWPQQSVVAAAAKSPQSCPTLCDPIDGSPWGSPVPGILQARTLKWVAISFSSAWKWKVKVKSLSLVRLLATPWTAAHQAPPSMGFSRKECNQWLANGKSLVQDTRWRKDIQFSFSSVALSCPTLCNPMDCSMPGLPVHHQLPGFTQTHVHWAGNAIQPSHPLSSPSPAFNLS